MHVTCPSCKFGGTVRDNQIPPDGKEVYCPNCNIKFRIRKNQSPPATSQKTQERTTALETIQSEYLPISCPICGFKGKLKRNAAATGQAKRFTCPSCKNPFTVTPSGPNSSLSGDTLPADTTRSAPSACTGCGSRITHSQPICPTCGKILTGIKIYCPSCRSANVGIKDKTHEDGTSQWETMIFRPASLTTAKQTDIHIPLTCRDCGKTWMIQPALIQTTDEPPGLSHEED
ncbi:MAG: zinc-ribbon domain-containing protein [Deltaproteobacteria bacterium]|nr:zinc-ribbon domain-containing protein [Candidatus Zymogenaceae bacterium]